MRSILDQLVHSSRLLQILHVPFFSPSRNLLQLSNRLRLQVSLVWIVCRKNDWNIDEHGKSTTLDPSFSRPMSSSHCTQSLKYAVTNLAVLVPTCHDQTTSTGVPSASSCITT